MKKSLLIVLTFSIIILLSYYVKRGRSSLIAPNKISISEETPSTSSLKIQRKVKAELSSDNVSDINDQIISTEESQYLDSEQTDFERQLKETEEYYQNTDHTEDDRRQESLKEAYQDNDLELIYHAN